MERLAEGDRYGRIKLDRAPWGATKILRKGGKHFLWATFALFTGLTFVAYFVPARELFPAALSLDLSGWPLFWSLFYGFATWGNAGFMREQVCKYMCPYARFQSAMFDRDTLIISYDEKRGEPRKSAAKKLGQPSADCVDCSMCVQVCPMGIDIRKGLQYECIACAACVDACNDVMDNVGKPRGLIHYTTARKESGGGFKLLRGRTVGYGLIWAALAAGFLVAVFLRTPVSFDVIRDRHSLYRELADDSVENVYTVKITNQDSRDHKFVLGAAFDAGGAPLLVSPSTIELPAGDARAITVSVRAPGDDLPRVSTMKFTLVAEDDARLERTRTATFFAEGDR
jgi:cytochrome c oxidase accessory protein FixG